MGDMTVTVDALKETAPGETRVVVTPASVQRLRASVQRLRASEIDVLVERDAGAGALLPARTYTDVGARRRCGAADPTRRRRPRNSRTRCPATRTAAVEASSSADCCKLAQQSSSSPHSTMPASSR
jgi:NAD/NADP transhydrogenase alpha subunit